MSTDSFDAAFFQALRGEDELGVVIRAHVHIEANLRDFLAVTARADELEKMNLDYSQRVHLAVALGLKKEHSKGFHALGQIRNAFAHRLDTSLSESRVNNLYKALAPAARAIVHMAYEKTEKELAQHAGRKFSSLAPRDRFVLIAVSLQAMLVIATREAKKRLLEK